MIARLMLGCLHICRLQLNTQIQQLEKYLRTVSVNEERIMSQFSASTRTPGFQYETPRTVPFRIDPTRLETQFQYNEPVGFDQWNSSPMSFSSNGISTAPINREAYIPTYIEVNYVDGSSDKKWSSRDFPWTKKLEVCTYGSIWIACISQDVYSDIWSFVLLLG